MKRVLALALALAGGPAWAQEQEPATQPTEEAPPPVAPPPTTPEEEGPIPEPLIPEDPMASLPPEPEAEGPTVRYEKRDYPVELVRRPLTLAAEQLEVSLDVPFLHNDGNPTLTQVLRAAFGATVDLQIGLTYSVGLERLDAQPGEDGFVVGKAFSVDGGYTLIPGYLAAQLRLAFFVDPDLFAMSVILGLPFKITLQERWALFGGADLVRVKIKGFAVDPADPAANAFQLSEIGRGVEASEGGASFVAGVLFQARQNVALHGTFGIGWPDFDTSNQPFALFFGATVTPQRWLDLGAKLGFASLDDPGASFAATVFLAARI